MNVAQIIAVIVGSGITSIGLIILGIFIALHYQEALKKYMVLFWTPISFFWKEADKKIVSNDIEGRVNSFTKSLEKEMKNYDPVNVKIQWVEEGESPSEFFNDGRLVIRMREHQNQNRNFVYASMVFIAQAVLPKAKKKISKSQKESLDIFIGKKLFEKEKPQVMDQFFDYYFAPGMEKEKIAEFVEKYNVIDKAALFFPVLVQELTFFGEKVYWKKKDSHIFSEFNALVDFLQDLATREQGEEELPKNFEGAYCRCGITLVSKQKKRDLGDINPYIDYIERLANKKIENIYIIGPATKDNINFVTEIVDKINAKGNLELYSEPMIYKAQIRRGSKRIETNSYILLLRNRETERYFDKEYQKQFIEPSLKD